MLYSFPIIRPSFRRIVALDVQMGYQTSLITVWERRNISNFILVLKKNVRKPALTRLFNENIRSVSKEGMLRADFGSRHLPFWKANIRRPLRLIKVHRNVNLFKRLWFLCSSWRVLVKQLQWSCFTSTLHESLLSRHGNLLTRCICAKSSPGRSWTEIINCLPFLPQSISTWLLASLYAYKNVLSWFRPASSVLSVFVSKPQNFSKNGYVIISYMHLFQQEGAFFVLLLWSFSILAFVNKEVILFRL